MKDLVVQISIGINSFYVHFFESYSHFSNSIQSVFGVRTNLSNQGIIILWDLIPRIQMRVGSDSKSTWRMKFCNQTWRRNKGLRMFGIYSAFDCVASTIYLLLRKPYFFHLPQFLFVTLLSLFL